MQIYSIYKAIFLGFEAVGTGLVNEAITLRMGGAQFPVKVQLFFLIWEHVFVKW